MGENLGLKAYALGGIIFGLITSFCLALVLRSLGFSMFGPVRGSMAAAW